MFVGGLSNDMSAVPLSKTEEVAKGLIEAISIRLGISEGFARSNAPIKGDLVVVLDPLTNKPFELGKNAEFCDAENIRYNVPATDNTIEEIILSVSSVCRK